MLCIKVVHFKSLCAVHASQFKKIVFRYEIRKHEEKAGESNAGESF